MRRIFFGLSFFLTLTACNLISSFPIPTGLPAMTALVVVKLAFYFTDSSRCRVDTDLRKDGHAHGSYDQFTAGGCSDSAGPLINDEKAQGAEIFFFRKTGFSELTIEIGVVRVYLTGEVQFQRRDLYDRESHRSQSRQFPGIQWIKNNDQNERQVSRQAE